MKDVLMTNFDIDSSRIPSGLGRRSFIKRMGAGLTIAISAGGYGVLSGCAESEAMDKPDFNAYLKIYSYFQILFILYYKIDLIK